MKRKVTFFLFLLLISFATVYFRTNVHEGLIDHRLIHRVRLKIIDTFDYNGEKELLKNKTKMINPVVPIVSFDSIQFNQSNQFQINSNDVIVFLHIQKTGGSAFSKHLIFDLDHQHPCNCQTHRKRCSCVRQSNDPLSRNWLVNRYTTGWICGLHSDWSGYHHCIDQALDRLDGIHFDRRYYFITFLRQPIARFLSEFNHVRRGATWKASRSVCNGQSLDVHNCYPGNDWKQVQLNEFMNCNHNPAINRLTRMLSNLSLVDCKYPIDSSFKENRMQQILLESAKQNLRSLSFFGLVEQQKVSQRLFEYTFGLKFRHDFIQMNRTHSSMFMQEITPDVIDHIRQLNHLDIELYEYAKRLLFDRLNAIDR